MAPRPDVDDLYAGNPPEWMAELNPDMFLRAAEIAARLIEDGYSEEQAYEIALERLQEEGGGDEEELYEDDVPGASV